MKHQSPRLLVRLHLFRSSVALAVLVGAGCVSSATTVSSRDIRQAGEQPRVPGSPLAAISADATRWQNAFDSTNATEIRQTFAKASVANELVARMAEWRESGTRKITIVPTYVVRQSRNRYGATIRFEADARAVPAYAFYTFEVSGKRATVSSTAPGIAGSDYLHVHWDISRSAHFTVYHSPYELEGSDKQFLNDLEYERAQIEKKFKVRLPRTAYYYLYPNTGTMDRLTHGACGSQSENVGCTNPYANPPTIQTSVWPTYHEPVHVYQLSFEPRPVGNTYSTAPLFIAEGMAVALEDREADPNLSDYCSDLAYIPLDACARAGIRQTVPLRLLSDAGFSRSNLGNAYALAGSFVKYLILKYGYVPFGKFYYKLAAQPKDRLQDYDVAAQAVYHSSMPALLSQWQRTLCSAGCG